MNRLLRRSVAALALVILVGGQVHAPALADDERPDLKIEVVGLTPDDPREVVVRVTNVGRWWADTTTATVGPVAPTPGESIPTTVPDLGPKGDKETASEFEFTYPLAAPCGGQKVEVKAVLEAAKTFNGNTEAQADRKNSEHTLEVCAPAAAPQPVPKPSEPAPGGIQGQQRFPGLPGAIERLPAEPAAPVAQGTGTGTGGSRR